MMDFYNHLLLGAENAELVEESEEVKMPQEIAIQSFWFDGQFGVEFETAEGEKVRLEDFGEWNHSAGPDFLRATLFINDQKFQGDIEIDLEAKNWVTHGHDKSNLFTNVILHVLCKKGRKTRFTATCENKFVPQIYIPSQVLENVARRSGYFKRDVSVHLGLCSSLLKNYSEQEIESRLESASRYRIHQKYLSFSSSVRAHGVEQTLWESVAQTLGYSKNKLGMMHLAQRLPIKTILKSKNKPAVLLFGVAGLLTSEVEYRHQSKEYIYELWEDWWKVRHLHQLSETRALPWVWYGSRPANHPQRRIGALAVLAENWSVFLKVYKTPGKLKHWLQSMEDSFWSNHYTLKSKSTQRPIALFGEERTTALLVNYVLPLLYQEDPEEVWAYYKRLTIGSLDRNSRIVQQKLFGKDHLMKFRRAWQQQGLLQIYKDFCGRHSCKDCSVPESLAEEGRWRV